MNEFKALVVRENESKITHQIEQINEDMLSEGNVLIKVMYSSVNYKDMLAVQAKGGVVRNYPMIPGIDLSGEIVKSEDPKFSVGQKVLVTGYKMGMTKTGGFSEYAKVPSSWVIPLPDKLTLKNAMVYGTAGFTAALSINELEKNGMKDNLNSRILVTGATGGVGSISLQILSKIGYTNITAIVRKTKQIEVAKKLGANNVILLEDFDFSKKLLAEEKFDYILDTVGGELISKLLPYVSYQGSVSLCGNAGGNKLDTTVLPFILRGINLLGIDSVNVSNEIRLSVWNKLSDDWDVADSLLFNEVSFNELSDTLNSLKEGKHLGRSIVRINEV
ncbi:oxidoreductase [Companilactobacillus sp. RD055328]|uniref:YhdH/YhfP family quinone oxidoreductase n=1 Tax=Companilactobacillus sp. RD055328 TaxID=2916634 RepID=UPI001FC8DF54|nr:YhdH/YhfP family quinone oxidoreductase [Companilactobacillus sp. RD055328]GKQ42149.1 oxidoreductase [Companilactobacillus sp. RD055328]